MKTIYGVVRRRVGRVSWARVAGWAGLACLALCVVSDAAWAQATSGAFQPVQTIAEQISSFLRGGFATTAATICIAAMGFAAWTGRIPWGWVFGFVIGCAFIFGGPQIVQAFSSISG